MVDRGGFSAAAEQLGISQPSVSYHMRALEETLGGQVVVYRDREVHLTPEGQELYSTAVSILLDAERLVQALDGLRTGRRGSLALGVSIAFEHKFFFDLVFAPFLDAHDDVGVTLTFGHSNHLTELVAAGRLDVAYVNDWLVPTGTRYQYLHSSKMVFWVSDDHPLALRDSVTPEEVGSAGLLTAPTEESEWQAFYGLLRSAGIRDPRIRVEIDGVQARKLATEAGLGVFGTFLPPYAGPDAMAPLKALLLSSETPTIDFGLVVKADRAPTPVMSDFTEWMATVVA